MTEEETNKKIFEIMSLIGVNPYDYSRAAANFRQMPSTELDARLARLRAEEREIDIWRKERGPAWGASLVELLARIEKSHALIGQKLGDLLLIVDKLQQSPSISIHMGEAIAKKVDEINALNDPADHSWAMQVVQQIKDSGTTFTGDYLVVKRMEDIAASYDTKLQDLEHAESEVASYLDHPILGSNSEPIGADVVVEALARIENDIAYYRPDMIVALNEGGFGVSEVVTADLNLNVPIIRVWGSGKQAHFGSEGFPKFSPRTVCVMGHVAWSGETMAWVMEHIDKVFKPDRIFGAVLIASGSAIKRLQPQNFTFHHVIEATTFRLASDPANGVTIEADQYIIGGDKTAVVSRDRLRLMRDQIAVSNSHPIWWK